MLTPQQRYQGLSPDLAETASNMQRALQVGDLKTAVATLPGLIKHAAQHPEVLRLRGACALAHGKPALGLQALAQAVRLRPHDGLIYYQLGDCYERIGDNARALQAFQSACNEDPQQPEYWASFGSALVHGGWNTKATAAFQRTLALAPHHKRARAMLATALNMDGRGDEAAAQYRQVLVDHPGGGLAWWGLATLKPMPLGPEDAQAMRRALAIVELDDDDRSAIHFALAHVLESEGDYAGALASLEQAHAVAARGRPPWPGAARRAEQEQMLEAFGAPPPATPEDLGREVIFIVSLPRSGSTLVEQILASHSQVTGTAELTDIRQVIGDASVKRNAPLLQWGPTLDADGWRALGAVYLQRTARWRKDSPRATDKMPGNWRNIGVILSMLPNARVVAVRRDPLETCLACYRMMLFGLDYTHTFAGLAEFSSQFDAAVDYWQSRYPQRVRMQSYETLTANPETEIHALLEFCDLPFEQGCIDFHTTRRRVTTPSAAQVRQPMRRDTARADKYGALLDPLRKALGLSYFDTANSQ